MSLDQFHIAQARRNPKPIRGASSLCGQQAVARLFIPLPVAEPRLPDRWSFRDEDMRRYTPMTNFERLQAYLVKRHSLEQAS